MVESHYWCKLLLPNFHMAVPWSKNSLWFLPISLPSVDICLASFSSQRQVTLVRQNPCKNSASPPQHATAQQHLAVKSLHHHVPEAATHCRGMPLLTQLTIGLLFYHVINTWDTSVPTWDHMVDPATRRCKVRRLKLTWPMHGSKKRATLEHLLSMASSWQTGT